ncbi:MAG: hypothetical protein WCD68_05820, partial [Candidatus Acidiferrum sp.]
MKRDRQGNLCLHWASAPLLLLIAMALGCGNSTSAKNAATSVAFHWKGRAWKITNGGMAGVAKGHPANIFVDQNGYLHLRIIDRGGTYTASEMFSADKMGFGTYQWQIEGAIVNMDKS